MGCDGARPAARTSVEVGGDGDDAPEGLHRLHDCGDGCDGTVGGIQCRIRGGDPTRGSVDDFADHRRGDSQRCSGQPCDGGSPASWRVRGNRSVECTGDPGCARDRDASGVRKYSGVQGIGGMPGSSPANRDGAAGSGSAGGCLQCDHKCSGRRCRSCALR